MHRSTLLFAMLLCAALRTAQAQDAIPTDKPAPTKPDPARYEKSIADFEAQDLQAAPPPGAIVMTGSSSMRGWHRRLAVDMAPLTVVPRGFGGSTIFDLDHFLDRVVLKYAPRAVVIYEGDNDLQSKFAPETVFATMQRVVERIHATNAATRVYLLATKPSPAREAIWPAMQRLNALTKAYCATTPNTTFIDTATPLLAPSGALRPELYKTDRLHLSDAGYDIWRDVVRAVLVPAEEAHERR